MKDSSVFDANPEIKPKTQIREEPEYSIQRAHTLPRVSPLLPSDGRHITSLKRCSKKKNHRGQRVCVWAACMMRVCVCVLFLCGWGGIESQSSRARVGCVCVSVCVPSRRLWSRAPLPPTRGCDWVGGEEWAAAVSQLCCWAPRRDRGFLSLSVCLCQRLKQLYYEEECSHPEDWLREGGQLRVQVRRVRSPGLHTGLARVEPPPVARAGHGMKPLRAALLLKRNIVVAVQPLFTRRHYPKGITLFFFKPGPSVTLFRNGPLAEIWRTRPVESEHAQNALLRL